MDADSDSKAKADGSGGAQAADLADICIDLSSLSLENEQELPRQLSQEEKLKREDWAK